MTGTNTSYVQSLVQDGIDLFMVASNGGGNQVWEFQGIGAQVNSTWGWSALTSPGSFNPQRLALFSDQLSMFNGSDNYWYTYVGSPNSWLR